MFERARKYLVNAGYLALGFAGVEISKQFTRHSTDAIRDYVQRRPHALLSMYDRFAGGALSHGSIAVLGIMPYLSARIFLAIAQRLSSTLNGWSDTQAGRHKLKLITRGLTFCIALIQSAGYIQYTLRLRSAFIHPGARYAIQTSLSLTFVAMFLAWIAEQATASDEDELTSAIPVPDVLPPVQTVGLIPTRQLLDELARRAKENAPARMSVTPH